MLKPPSRKEFKIDQKTNIIKSLCYEAPPVTHNNIIHIYKQNNLNKNINRMGKMTKWLHGGMMSFVPILNTLKSGLKRNVKFQFWRWGGGGLNFYSSTCMKNSFDKSAQRKPNYKWTKQKKDCPIETMADLVSHHLYR